MTTLFTEGWPIFAAIALVVLITWGALRPHLKGTARQDRKKDQENDRQRPDQTDGNRQ